MDQPEVHEAIAAMRRVADEYGDRLLIGEAYLPFDRLMAYYGVGLTGFHLPFNFELIFAPWEPRAIAALVAAYEAALPEGAWPNWVLGNHDRPRVASRIGPDQARVAAMLLLTLRGAPTIYQGEEIGMRDVPISPERVQDPWGRRVPGFGRDPVRTPMPWNAELNGGFTSGGPWLPLGSDLATINVAAQEADPRSMLSLYRALLRLRRSEPALSIGSYVPVAATDRVLAYERRHRGRRLLVALNMSGEPVELPTEAATILLSTTLEQGRAATSGQLLLRPHEGCIGTL
jgi:alpha-glucosidase